MCICILVPSFVRGIQTVLMLLCSDTIFDSTWQPFDVPIPYHFYISIFRYYYIYTSDVVTNKFRLVRYFSYLCASISFAYICIKKGKNSIVRSGIKSAHR